MLKISDTTDHNGKWVYEDMGKMNTDNRKLRTMLTVGNTMGTVLECQIWERVSLLDNAKWEVPK